MFKHIVTTLALLGVVGASNAAQFDLTYPGDGYPALLGVSCGGVHIATYATGFDSNGSVTGEIYAWTRCSAGSGRGGGYRTKTYSSWHSAVWGLDGTFYSLLPWDGITPDPAWVETDDFGNSISTEPGRVLNYSYSGLLTTP